MIGFYPVWLLIWKNEFEKYLRDIANLKKKKNGLKSFQIIVIELSKVDCNGSSNLSLYFTIKKFTVILF